MSTSIRDHRFTNYNTNLTPTCLSLFVCVRLIHRIFRLVILQMLFKQGKSRLEKVVHTGVSTKQIIAITLLANAEVIEQLLTESELGAAARGCWGIRNSEEECHVKSFYTFVTRPAPRDVIAVSLCLGPENSANAACYRPSAQLFLMFAQTSSNYR